MKNNSKNLIRHVFVPAGVFFSLVFVFTYPLLLKTTRAIPGFPSSDEPFAALWIAWKIKFSVLNHLSLTRTDLIAYPFGLDLYGSGILSSVWLAWTHALSLITNPAFWYNAQVLINLLLIFIITYELVLLLLKDEFPAIFSAVILTFCPYQFVRTWQHLSLTYNQWIVLALTAAIILRNKFTRTRVLFFLLSLLLLLTFDFSVMYLGCVALVGYCVYVAAYQWKVKFSKNKEILKEDFRYLRRFFAIGIIAFIIVSPQFIPIIKNIVVKSPSAASAHNPFHRAFEDLFAQSARPLSYFLPATSQPIFGRFTENFVGTDWYGESLTEHALYLGWVPLIFAFIAVRRWKKEGDACKNEVGRSNKYYTGMFLFLAIFSWLFSQPPWWSFGPIRIFMPSFFMYKVLPMYRAYCRFGIVVMFSISVLAGFGLSAFLAKFRKQTVKAALTCLFSGLVLFEFWNYPPFKVIDVSKVPAAYYWLKEQPGNFAIAEYPFDSDSPNEMYKFYQTVHEKKIVNGTIPGTKPNVFAHTLTRLSDFGTADLLRVMNVKYVVVHEDGYTTTELVEDAEELNRIPRNQGLRLIKGFPSQECSQEDIMCVEETGPIDIYEVVISPKGQKRTGR